MASHPMANLSWHLAAPSPYRPTSAVPHALSKSVRVLGEYRAFSAFALVYAAPPACLMIILPLIFECMWQK